MTLFPVILYFSMWKNFLFCEMYDESVTDGALVYNYSVFWRNVKTLLSCSCMRTLSVPQGPSMLTTWGRSKRSFLSWRYWMGSVMSCTRPSLCFVFLLKIVKVAVAAESKFCLLSATWRSFILKEKGRGNILVEKRYKIGNF